ncbi:hypothetical protein HPB52_019891 [Rhipicephalus sanguineus]|uniref:Uncharacterized protein n=1 Tax=Rhipicephalus sanguineus TaxID=34632 RepID=A0A9D4SV31_RHISA|nr:hypothetical protein HPB52_019891 [Rhipicephalus sanguineus]
MFSPTASRTRTPSSVSPEPKTTGARVKVPKSNALSPHSKKSVSVSPNQTPATSSPMIARVQPADRQQVWTAAGSGQLTPVVASSSQTAGLSVTPPKEAQAGEESREVKPQVPNDVERSMPAAVSPSSLPATAPMLMSPPLTIPNRERQPVVVAVLSAVALVMIVVAFAVIWLTSPRPSFLNPKNTSDDSFCCPNEAAQLRDVIDADVSPCRDFFAYVCKRAIQDSAIQVGVAVDTLDEIAANIIKGTGNFTSPAARALHGYFTSCLSEVWQRDLRHKQVTSFIVGVANTTSGRMTPVDLLRFALNIHIRYQLDFFFGLDFGDASVEFEWNFLRAITFHYYCGNDCFETALAGANAHLKTNYTRRDIEGWQRLLPRAIDAASPGDITRGELLEAFAGMDASLFEAVMKEFYPDFNIGYRAFTEAKRPLLKEIRILWNVSYQPMTLCYMIVSVAIEAMKQVQGRTAVDSPTSQIWEICGTHAARFTELWRLTYVDSLTNPAKDFRMHSLFQETKEALLRYEPLRGLMEAGNDVAKFEAFVRKTSLQLPGDMVLNGVRVPVLQPHGFVDNYFRALGFDFDVRREVWHLGVQYLRQNIDYDLWHRMGIVKGDLYVSPIAYGYLSSVNASRALLADAPVIVVRMAAQLWKKLIRHRDWSARTLAAIKYHRDCILKTFRVPEEVAVELLGTSVALQIAASVAAGATSVSTDGSLVGAADDWLTQKMLWGFFVNSKARFFYARYAYFTCSEDEYAWNYINEPVRHSADFAAAFKCPALQETTNSSACWNYGR